MSGLEPADVTASPLIRKRAKPLLGTVVEIAVCSVNDAIFIRATDAAFARVAAIHHAMSFHESTSDLIAIANAKAGQVLSISPDTWKTLALALKMEAHSNGLFNPTIAHELVRRGILPSPIRNHHHHPVQSGGLKNSIALEEDFHIRIQSPAWIDLGGIAKGYAVDEAVATLAKHGALNSVVNAGGDLRVLGEIEHAVSVRVPSAPHLVLPVASLRNLSCATTARYYSDDHEGSIVGARSKAAANYDSVSVMAPSCAEADALTKVLWLGGPDTIEIREMLLHFKANAALIDLVGVLHRL